MQRSCSNLVAVSHFATIYKILNVLQKFRSNATPYFFGTNVCWLYLFLNYDVIDKLFDIFNAVRVLNRLVKLLTVVARLNLEEQCS